MRSERRSKSHFQDKGRDGGIFDARRHASDHNFRALMGVKATREQPPGEPTLHRNHAGRENGFAAGGFDLAC